MALNTTALLRLQSPESRLPRIELLVLVGVVALLLLVLLGAYRRRSSNMFVKLVIWASYAVSYPLVSYTLGLIQSFPYGNGLFSVWAISLFLFLSSADSISAYSLADNDQWKRFHVQQMIQAFWFGWVVGTFTPKSDFKVRLWLLYTVTILKTVTRMAPFRWASNSYMLPESTKCIADYMSYEHELNLERDPVTMRGYRYVVAGEYELQKYVPQPPEYLFKYNDGMKLVTVERIWESDGSLLLGERGEKLKDLCISMALSKMLKRRFAGFQLTESELHKAREFLFDGLLHGKSYCERAFRVIEAELAFVHDYFYTKYHIIYITHNLDTVLSVIMIPLCIWLAVGLWKHFRESDQVLILIPYHKRNYDALITFVIVVGIALIEVFQVYLYLVSAWCKVALISRYVVKASLRNSSWAAKSIGYIVSLKSFRYWQDSLGQYTLLKSFDYKPRLENALHRLTFSLVDKVRKGHKEGKHVRLSRDVKEAVLESLKRSNGRLTNGVASLQANQVFDLLSWACTLPTTAHTIFAWHIATTICEEDNNMKTYNHSHVSVACSLSKYCAYLVVSAPKLLPDHSCVSGTIFGALVREASELLDGEMTQAQRCHKLIAKADADPEDDRLIIRGARLGVQLTRRIQDPAVRWKVLHDFWAEFMMYVAPSKDAWAHLETLTRGGEFITHLWVLLTHGGILDRETAAQDHDT